MFKNARVRNRIEKISATHSKYKQVVVYDCNNGIEEQPKYWAFVEDLTPSNLEEFFPKMFLDRFIETYKDSNGVVSIGVDLRYEHR